MTSTSTEELIRQLADSERREAAERELVRRGHEAIPALTQAVALPQAPPHQAAILRTLLAIADPRSEDTFRRAVASSDPEIRSIGAQGLHRLGAPDSLAALQLAINDAPDPLHFALTAAVQSLIGMGMAALPTIFTLMESPEERTRQRAQYALAAIVLRNITQQLQPRPLTSDAQAAWERLRQANGSYDWDGPEDARRASIARWRRWFSGTPGNPEHSAP